MNAEFHLMLKEVVNAVTTVLQMVDTISRTARIEVLTVRKLYKNADARDLYLCVNCITLNPNAIFISALMTGLPACILLV
jgi:hypothetical protein